MIPAELTALPQWVLYRIEDRGGPKPTKVPYSAKTGYACSITDPANFSTYGDCINGHAVGFNGQGIVATKDDPYTYFDLDDPFGRIVNGEYVIMPIEDPEGQSIAASHRKIIEHLNSYTEWSPSGRGLRVVIRGKLPEGWRNRIGKVEIYSCDRFVTMTGNHVEGTPLTVEDRQTQLEDIAQSLGLDKGNTGNSYESQPETQGDAELFAAICRSAVADKFLQLFNGDTSGHASGSEADLALANYISAFTQNKEQAERIFRGSVHYTRREKLHTRADLVTRAINKGFDLKPPPINVTILRQTADALAAAAAPELHPEPQALTVYPPGLMGSIANYLYATAPRAMPEAALAGAIGLMGGIAGRAFNTHTGSGLNQYVVMIAPSSYGKDHIRTGMSRLMREVSKSVESAIHFIGPSHIASASALYKAFDKGKAKSPSFVSIIPEFGEWLEIHNDPNAKDNNKLLMRAVLDIYSVSGKGQTAGSMIYSEREKNIEPLDAPAFSFIGDTVPGSFNRATTPEAITKGLITRMFQLEYKGDIPPLNLNAGNVQPDSQFLDHMAHFAFTCKDLNQKNLPTAVPLSPEAQALFDTFNTHCENQIRQFARTDRGEMVGAVYGRAWLKALKLAALVAVGVNWLKPLVLDSYAAWAIELTKRDAHTLLGKLESGEISSGSISDDRHKIILSYFAKVGTKPLPASYAIPDKLREIGLLSDSYLWNKAKNNNAFRTDRRGERGVFDNAIKEMLDMGILTLVGNHENGVVQWVPNECKIKWYAVKDPRQLIEAS